MIESFVEGRVRLRSALLADAALAEIFSAGLMKIGGVQKVTINPRTNGALLEYDKTRLPLSVLQQAAALFARVNELEKLPGGERISALEEILEELSEVLGG